MTAVYTYTDARQNFASLLDKAMDEGEVRIERRDGQVFVIKPEPISASPLDIEGMELNITTDEIVQYIAESRRYQQLHEDEALGRLDEMMVRLAERNAHYDADEVAADIAAAIDEIRAQDQDAE